MKSIVAVIFICAAASIATDAAISPGERVRWLIERLGAITKSIQPVVRYARMPELALVTLLVQIE